MKDRHFSILDFEYQERKIIQTDGYELALQAICRAPYSYQIISIEHRNQWSLRVHAKKNEEDFLLVIVDPTFYSLQQLSFLQKREMRLSKIANTEFTLLPTECIYDERIVFQKYAYKKLLNFKDHIAQIQLEVLDWVPEILKCVQQLSRSLFALHQNLHFHLGISWENLYVDSNGQFTLLGFGMGSRLTSQSKEWSPPEIHIGYPQSEVGDFFALGKLIGFIYKEIPIFEQEKYSYLEEVFHRLLDENPLHRLQSHEDLQRLLEPSKVFRFYRHWNADNFSSKVELHKEYVLIGNEILRCDADFLFNNGLSLPTCSLFEGKLLSGIHPILWNFFYLFEDSFYKTVHYETYTRSLQALSAEEKVFVTWLHRIKKDKKELVHFASVLDSYANLSDMWSHLIDYFQRQWPEYRCMFVQFDTPKECRTELDYLCTVPIFQQMHLYQYTLQDCIDRAESQKHFLDLSLYFLTFNGNGQKAQKMFAEGVLVELSHLPKDLLETILQSFNGLTPKISIEQYDNERLLRNSQRTIAMLHYAIIMGLNHFADILLEMIYKELTRLSISNQLRFIQNIAVGLGNHPFIAQVCLDLEQKVEQDGDIDSLCKVLDHIGLHRRVQAVKRTQAKKIQRKISNLKSIAIQNNIDIQLHSSEMDTESLTAIKLEIEKKLNIKTDKGEP